MVVGAHLRGEPLNHQLTDLGATFVEGTRTLQEYRLFALTGTTPPKPGLVRVAEGGASIEVERLRLPTSKVGSFLAQVPSPLCIGAVRVADGSTLHGFLCEPKAIEGSIDITHFGGWRAYRGST